MLRPFPFFPLSPKNTPEPDLSLSHQRYHGPDGEMRLIPTKYRDSPPAVSESLLGFIVGERESFILKTRQSLL